MSHEAYEELISAQLDGDLSPEEEADLKAHLAVCPRCRAAKQEIEAVHRLLLGSAAVPPTGLTERIMANLEPPKKPEKKVPLLRRIMPLAAAALVALVVVGVVKPSFDAEQNREEYALATETALEETADQEEALPEALPSEESAAETSPEEATAAGEALTPIPTAQNVSSSSSQTPPGPSQEAAAPSSEAPSEEAKAEQAPQAPSAELQEAETEAVPAESVSEESPAQAEAASGAETAAESAEEDTLSQAAGGAENETISDAQPTSTLTWQQARDRLCEYLGEVPDDLTAQDMSPGGESWLFTARGIQYAVDRLTGEVTQLTGEE